MSAALYVKENGFLLTLQMDVKAPVILLRGIAMCQQCVPPVARHQGQHLIFLISRIIGKVNPCKKLPEHPTRKHRYGNVWRLQDALGPRDATWPDRLKFALAIFIRA